MSNANTKRTTNTSANTSNAEATVNDARKAGTETMTTIFKTMQETMESMRSAAEKTYNQSMSMAQAQNEQATKAMFKGYEEMMAASQDMSKTMSDTTGALSKAFEDMGKMAIGYAQQAIESNVSATKALVGCKNPKEALDVQADWAKTSLDSCLVESNRMSDMSMKLANDAFEPLQKRANETVSRLFKAVQ
jgi:phasin family protein